MRPTVTRTLTTTSPPEAVFAYLADFRNAEEWDPGTRTCERVSGDGGVGTVYRNVSSFLGRQVELTYTTTELEEPTRIHLEGRNETFHGHDVFGVRAHGTGTEVTYHVEFEFSGAARLAAPFVQAYLPVLARQVLARLQSCLDGLAR